jgi:hypothetical protein
VGKRVVEQPDPQLTPKLVAARRGYRGLRAEGQVQVDVVADQPAKAALKRAIRAERVQRIAGVDLADEA